jgi:NAD(P)-dependent dehydrogenase (short-subunit alcohol dehydrogenase family)
MDLRLSGRVFYVTGGSRGVGRAIVTALLSEGARVATCARDVAALGAAYLDLPRERLLLHQCDVLDSGRMSTVVTEAARRFGRLDGLVANAGAGAFGRPLETDPPVWTRQFEIKVHGVLNVVRPAVPLLEASGGGAVVVVNGVTAHAPEADMAAVSAARAAARNLSLVLAMELAPQGIRVNTVNLGPIVTDRQRARHASAGSSLPFDDWCTLEARRRGIPLGRLGLPEQVVPAVLLLLSPLSSYTTGASIDVSGGLGARF